MDEIIKLVEEARFARAIMKVLLLSEGPEAETHEFQISEYAWTRAYGLRIRMNLVLREHE